MERVQITLPREVPNCPINLDPVVDAIVGVCEHFFEKSNFQEYIERGGRNCPTCRQKITWYAEVPNYREKLGEPVLVQPVKLEGEHRVEHHQETTSLEEGVVLNLFLIERAVSEEGAFFAWCMEKDGTATQSLQARLTYDSVASESRVGALQTHRALAKKLYDFFDYKECRSIQEFVNKLFRNELNFFLYNLLLREAFIHQVHESAQQVMGGEVRTQTVDPEKIVDDAELGKKMRTVIGLIVTLSLMIGFGRKIFRLYSFTKNTNIFVKN